MSAALPVPVLEPYPAVPWSAVSALSSSGISVPPEGNVSPFQDEMVLLLKPTHPWQVLPRLMYCALIVAGLPRYVLLWKNSSLATTPSFFVTCSSQRLPFVSTFTIFSLPAEGSGLLRRPVPVTSAPPSLLGGHGKCDTLFSRIGFPWQEIFSCRSAKLALMDSRRR